MSHFAVLVVTPEEPTDEILRRALQPFHEFECTGDNDEYVVDVDDTESTRSEFAEYAKEGETFAAFCERWKGLKAVQYGERPDLDGKHKFGYVALGENGEGEAVVNRTNPNAKWDCWTVGGRYSGRLKVGGSDVDSGRKDSVDFAAMRAERGAQAGKDWDEFDEAIAGNPWPKTWPEVRKEYPGDIDAARKAYNDQPAVKAVRESKAESLRFTMDCPFAIYGRDRAAYVAAQEHRTPCMFAMLRDGKWAEKGSMGWFAIVTDEKADWADTFRALLDDVPGDHWLTVVDCHISDVAPNSGAGLGWRREQGDKTMDHKNTDPISRDPSGPIGATVDEELRTRLAFADTVIRRYREQLQALMRPTFARDRDRRKNVRIRREDWP